MELCKLKLRKATLYDAKLLFDWANDSETRKNSFSTEPIIWENHLKWLKKRVADEVNKTLILTDGNTDYGTLRLDKDTDRSAWVISYSIAPEHRGCGLGKEIIRLATDEVGTVNNIIIGEVKLGNMASRHCFEVNGFDVLQENEDEIIYQKRI